MELREFVADALDQIANGVADAIHRQDEAGGVARIAPIFQRNGAIDWSAHTQAVEFDLALEITSKASAKAGVVVRVLTVLNLAAEGEGAREKSMVNKVKFSVPVLLPGHLTEAGAVPRTKGR